MIDLTHTMETIMFRPLVLTASVLLLATPAFAAGKTYQVTGPVTALDDSKITVQKGKENWEIARGSAAVPEGVKVGSKVTVQYTMTADSITAKDAPKGKK